MKNLGDEVKDTITGFKGIVVARTEWLNGCARVTVQPQKLKSDGTPVESQTFDEFQLVVLKSAKMAVGRRDTGGPRPEPQQKSGSTQ